MKENPIFFKVLLIRVLISVTATISPMVLRLHGYTTDLDDAGRLEVYVEYCLGKGIKDHQAREYARANPESTIGKTDHKKSPTIYGMVFDEDGTTRVETKKKVYRVEYKSWKNLPSNYPSNTEGDWWEKK